MRLAEGRVPRIGWAEVDDRGAFYFAHSYAAVDAARDRVVGGHRRRGAHGSFVGVQFHPEKSGAAGARYLEEEVRSLSLA